MKKNIFFAAGALICLVAFAGTQIINFQSANKQVEIAKQEIALAKTAPVEVVEAPVKESVKTTPVVKAEAPKQCFKDIYADGDTFGIIRYLDVESALVVGADESNLEHTAMLHGFSDADNMVVLGHGYANGTVFGKLWALQPEDSVSIISTDGTELSFKVSSTEWISEEYYNSEEGRRELFDRADDLKLATCQTKEGVQGRLIIHCTLQ